MAIHIRDARFVITSIINSYELLSMKIVVWSCMGMRDKAQVEEHH